MTRDVYSINELFPLKFIQSILKGIASVCCHLHSLGINHGDLYAHNILVLRPNDDDNANQESNIDMENIKFLPPILGDFGAATLYSQPLDDSKKTCQGKFQSIKDNIERIEVRAFGCLIEELLDRLLVVSNDTSNQDSDSAAKTQITNKGIINRLRMLQARCLDDNILQRPNFLELSTLLNHIFSI